MSAATRFVSAIRSLNFDDAFNPYRDRCQIHDRADAPAKRSAALRAIIDAATSRGIHSIWVGRDLGYRGGRRTGLALTDDVHVAMHGARWGVNIERPTKGPAVRERTAALAWSVLEEIELPVFLWNVFPLHPHEPGLPFTNRSHKSAERAAGEELLSELLTLLRPERVVALGGDAARCAERVAGSCVRIRHPSYGGQAEFLRQMSDLYGRRVGNARRQGDLLSHLE
ncbi:uracil-DNA glycosylase [Bradyrhizobium sp. Arg62]|uniref:uracil-DNA glycosylase n=1 Tax=Bradyrhizobium brasilense TaxID=1419277 RepID=UPI001E38CAFA|nr:uracil-DNA glycosylase [Bradyrhizobium brasilense]MCC8948182.1 uracil-DNA glycosylase [Bradyrhizobium brasilense]